MIGAPDNNNNIVSIFAGLRQLYPTWEEMREYLTSDAGGNLNVSEIDGFTTITYKSVGADGKGVIFPTEEAFERISHLEWFQRVIWDKEANLPLAVMPRRCKIVSVTEDATLNDMRAKYRITPYKEGIIKSGFFICENDRLYMPADCNFPDYPAVNDPRRYHATFINYLISGPGKSIVHEEAETIAQVIQKAQVYIDGTIEFDDNFGEEIAFDEEVMGPAGQPFETCFNKFMAQQDLLYAGWVLVEKATGRRYVKMGRFYEEARDYKKISRSPKYRLLELRRRGDVSHYLNIFPAEVPIYDSLKMKIHSITNDLLSNYLARWQAKTKGWADIPKQYYKHIAALNNIYHTELKPKRWVIRLANVVKYINELPAAQLLFLVNRFGMTSVKHQIKHEADTEIDVAEEDTQAETCPDEGDCNN
jgi:hypothetical protein